MFSVHMRSFEGMETELREEREDQPKNLLSAQTLSVRQRHRIPKSSTAPPPKCVTLCITPFALL